MSDTTEITKSHAIAIEIAFDLAKKLNQHPLIDTIPEDKLYEQIVYRFSKIKKLSDSPDEIKVRTIHIFNQAWIPQQMQIAESYKSLIKKFNDELLDRKRAILEKNPHVGLMSTDYRYLELTTNLFARRHKQLMNDIGCECHKLCPHCILDGCADMDQEFEVGQVVNVFTPNPPHKIEMQVVRWSDKTQQYTLKRVNGVKDGTFGTLQVFPNNIFDSKYFGIGLDSMLDDKLIEYLKANK